MTRVVSCNTTSIVRTLTALKKAGLLKRARGTLIRRASDPWEAHGAGRDTLGALSLPVADQHRRHLCVRSAS